MRKLVDLPTKQSSKVAGKVGVSHKHESADKHVSGKAIYIDDRPELANQLHGAIGQSTIDHGVVKSMDLSAVKANPGVVSVITSNDGPGQVVIGPVFGGEPVLVEETVEFMGQTMFEVAVTVH